MANGERCWVTTSDNDERIVEGVSLDEPHTYTPRKGFVVVEYVRADLHREVIDRERNYRAALERITNTKSIDLAIGIASITLGTNHPGGSSPHDHPPP